MDGVANLADAMLILAVGIMLALIINWKVDISTAAYTSATDSGIDTKDALTFENEDLAQSEEQQVSGDSLEKLGTVYFDEKTGTYYIIEEPEE